MKEEKKLLAEIQQLKKNRSKACAFGDFGRFGGFLTCFLGLGRFGVWGLRAVALGLDLSFGVCSVELEVFNIRISRAGSLHRVAIAELLLPGACFGS